MNHEHQLKWEIPDNLFLTINLRESLRLATTPRRKKP
jgi:hypothetical protein